MKTKNETKKQTKKNVAKIDDKSIDAKNKNENDFNNEINLEGFEKITLPVKYEDILDKLNMVELCVQDGVLPDTVVSDACRWCRYKFLCVKPEEEKPKVEVSPEPTHEGQEQGIAPPLKGARIGCAFYGLKWCNPKNRTAACTHAPGGVGPFEEFSHAKPLHYSRSCFLWRAWVCRNGATAGNPSTVG